MPDASSLSFPQQPGMEVRNIRGELIGIPAAAMPSRDFDVQTRLIRPLDEDSEEEDAEDLRFINSYGNNGGDEEPFILDPASTDFRPGLTDLQTLPCLDPPEWATSTALRTMSREVKKLRAVQASIPLHELGWYVDFDNMTNLFRWIVQLHSFEPSLPLVRDMKTLGVPSIILEVRFGKDYPLSPPFIRIVRPRFLPFSQGGGGHITAGGAVCMELLTATGWSPANSMESVLLQVRLAMSSTEPAPARLVLAPSYRAVIGNLDYTAVEATAAFERVARHHGWEIPSDHHSVLYDREIQVSQVLG